LIKEQCFFIIILLKLKFYSNIPLGLKARIF